MKEKLEQYIDLLFAGSHGTDDMKQEILQNTTERYEDLIEQGKTPEAAYQLAISGIGDISELLNPPEQASDAPENSKQVPKGKRILWAVAIALYILCPVPVIVFSEIGSSVVGIAGLFILVAIATALIILSNNKYEQADSDEKEDTHEDKRSPAEKAINAAITPIGLCVYFLVSFKTHMWSVTWLIFPVMAALSGLVRAIFDLKGDK